MELGQLGRTTRLQSVRGDEEGWPARREGRWSVVSPFGAGRSQDGPWRAWAHRLRPRRDRAQRRGGKDPTAPYPTTRASKAMEAKVEFLRMFTFLGTRRGPKDAKAAPRPLDFSSIMGFGCGQGYLWGFYFRCFRKAVRSTVLWLLNVYLG